MKGVDPRPFNVTLGRRDDEVEPRCRKVVADFEPTGPSRPNIAIANGARLLSAFV
jgi:hypothetical protein